MKNKVIYEEFSVRNPGKFILFYPSYETSPCYLHWHDETEFIFFDEPGSITLGNESIKVEKNSFITVNRNEFHSVEKGKYSSLIVLDSFFIETNPIGNLSFTKLIKDDTTIEEAFRNMNKEYSVKEPGYDMQIKGIVFNLLTYLLRNYKAENNQSAHITKNKSYFTPLSKIIDYIDKNYCKPISTAELAAEFHISIQHLCHIFKAHTDYTPIEYINNLRIKRSTRLLSNKEKNITEIAQAVGFENSSYYTKVFKKKMGVTPTQYRKYQQL